MTELWRSSACELAKGIANGSFSSTDVVQQHLDRIADVNEPLNAVVAVMGDAALEAAADVDRRVAAGEDVGALGGVPFTIKENIDVAGSATTQGLPALAEAIAQVDAPVVERMLGAGAIPIGRTNLPEMGLRLTTDNALHGVTRNPWNTGRTTGGSSGGEAAALAAGMSPIGLGNDIGGSLRNPANCCGIASIKPTTGVIPHHSTIPGGGVPISSQLMVAEGPMARRVGDVRLGLDILRGYHPKDPLSISADLTSVDRPLRIAVMAEPPGGDVDPGIAAATRAAADALDAAGCAVAEADPPGFDDVIRVWADLLMNDVSMGLPLLEPLLSEDALHFIADFREGRADPTLEGYATALMERLEIGQRWGAFFTDYDLILSPTWTQLPFEHGWDIAQPDRSKDTMTMARCVLPGNALGLPSACVPAGTVEGLPVGVLLTGANFSDHLCLDAAEMIEAALGLDTPIDPRN